MCHSNMLLQAWVRNTLLLCIFMLRGSFLMSSQMLGIWLKTYELVWTDSHPEVLGKIVLCTCTALLWYFLSRNLGSVLSGIIHISTES